ncbi:MAG TPA: hypothetical protein PK878_12090 [bacterium]|mgnify:FL=1|nr:hypothetical protein [bacterium]
MAKTKGFYMALGLCLLTMPFLCHAQAPEFPGMPEDNGLTPRTSTLYINTPDTINNSSTESLGAAIANNGNIIIGWEDDGDGVRDLEAVWTMFDGNGVSITPDTVVSVGSQTMTTKFLAFFRSDGSAVAGATAWGPKIKANLFGDGVGMGATAFSLGEEIAELADINLDEGGGGDFPAVQLLTNTGQPVAVLSGVSDEDAEPAGNIRIGDWDYLSNGNIVIIGESRQADDLVTKYGGAAPGNHAIYRIVTPSGEEVRPVGLVSSNAVANEIWHGVGVTRNGFAVRFNEGGRAQVRLFTNDGTPKGDNIDLGTLAGNEGPAGGGRGDGTGFHGNGVDAYAVCNSADANGDGAREVYLTVINEDGTLRYSRIATDDFEFANSDRVDCAIDAQGRVLAAFMDNDVTGLTVHLVQARLFDATGEPLGGTFFVSERETVDNYQGESRRPRAALRGNTAVITWESTNHESTSDRVVAFRVFDVISTGVDHFMLY